MKKISAQELKIERVFEIEYARNLMHAIEFPSEEEKIISRNCSLKQLPVSAGDVRIANGILGNAYETQK